MASLVIVSLVIVSPVIVSLVFRVHHLAWSSVEEKAHAEKDGVRQV
jgi:hypothetical protein